MSTDEDVGIRLFDKLRTGTDTDLSHRLFEKSMDLMDTGAPAECYEMYSETLDNGVIHVPVDIWHYYENPSYSAIIDLFILPAYDYIEKDKIHNKSLNPDWIAYCSAIEFIAIELYIKSERDMVFACNTILENVTNILNGHYFERDVRPYDVVTGKMYERAQEFLEDILEFLTSESDFHGIFDYAE